MSDDSESNELTEETIQLYNDFYDMAIQKLYNDHSGVAVAGTMIGIAMRLYRTALDDQEYIKMMDYILTNYDLIEPYTNAEFESPTIH